jgi:hypothetical protein
VYWRALDRVRLAGLVLAEIHPLGVPAVGRDAELDAEEPPRRWRRDIHVDYAVAHLEVVDRGRTAVEQQACPALVVGHLRLSLQIPLLRVGLHRECLTSRRG